MQFKYLFSIVFLTFISSCFSQTLKGIYSRQALKGIGDSSELNEKAKKPMYFSYVYSESTSLQELIEGRGISIDTVYKEYAEVPGEKFASEGITIMPKNGFYYKNFKTNNYKVYFDQNNKETYISDDLPKYEWNLVNDSKIISGYKCKKATTIKNIMHKTQNIVAWYCEEITINDGPMDFSGLPGFIIQIEINDTSVMKFEKIKIISNENSEIKLPEISTNPITIKGFETNTLNGR
uniref:GLPGLI family protein n=1 Tax=Flavobacterium sp. TaxID=239 RepID=UPI0040496971